MSDASKADLRQLIAPVLARVAELDPASRTDEEAQRGLVEALEAEFPSQGETVRTIGQEIARGVREGWLCDRGEPEARFCRLAKPGPETHGLSVDIVSLSGRAVEHTHPKGEVTIGFVAPDEGGDQTSFDGHPAGWVFLGPGSRHVPEVVAGRMHLMYFLPDGAVEWHR